MKYFSEITGNMYDTTEALLEAEKTFLKADSAIIDDLDTTVSSKEEFNDLVETPSKKQLAAEVEAAEEKLTEEYANYDVAKKKIEELSKQYLKDVNDILEPAKAAVKAAEMARYEAIRKFNEAYGVYRTELTGDRAAKELLRTLNSFNNWNSIFNNHWF